jgi:hypothetical protein
VTVKTPQIDIALLDSPPPRSLPPTLIADLLGDRLLERPMRSYADPLLIGAIVAALAFALLRVPVWLAWAIAGLGVLRIALLAWSILGPSLDDLWLLRYGVLVDAQVTKLRQAGTPGTTNQGAFLDCSLAISPNRSTVCSVWVADSNEAARMASQKHLLAIGLPRAPGAWRLLETRSSELRYNPVRTALPPTIDERLV